MKGIVGVDKGFYQEARTKGVHPLTLLTDEVRPEPAEVEQVAARCLRRFGQEDDGSPRAQMIGQYAYDICGLEKELAVRGIRTRGPGADVVEKFFASSDNTALFPAYMASQIIAGQMAVSLVPQLAAAEIRINSHIAEKITMADSKSTRTLKWLGEGADLPKTQIKRSEGTITLYKYGRLLEASYESVRLMRLDILGLQLQRMGRQIGLDQTDDLIETLIAGDGTASSAITDTDALVSGTLDYNELVRLFLAFPVGYEMRHAVINATHLRTLLNMAEFKDPVAGFNFQRTGQLPGPMGATWHRWDSDGSASFSNDRVLAVDNRNAVALFREGDLLEEADMLIDKQLHRRSLSEWVGYMKLDSAASQCLDIVP